MSQLDKKRAACILLAMKDPRMNPQFCIDWLKQDPTEFLAKQRAKWRSAQDWVEPVENSTAVEQVDFSAINSEEISDLCCTCQQPYNEEELYYGCDSCGGWFHPECMGMDGVAISRANRARKWYCNGYKLIRATKQKTAQQEMIAELKVLRRRHHKQRKQLLSQLAMG